MDLIFVFVLFSVVFGNVYSFQEGKRKREIAALEPFRLLEGLVRASRLAKVNRCSYFEDLRQVEEERRSLSRRNHPALFDKPQTPKTEVSVLEKPAKAARELARRAKNIWRRNS